MAKTAMIISVKAWQQICFFLGSYDFLLVRIFVKLKERIL